MLRPNCYVSFSVGGRVRLRALLIASAKTYPYSFEEIIQQGVDRALIGQILMWEDYDWAENLLVALLPYLLQAAWDGNTPIVYARRNYQNRLQELISSLESPKPQSQYLTHYQLYNLRTLLVAMQKRLGLKRHQMPKYLGISKIVYRDIMNPSVDTIPEIRTDALKAIAAKCPHIKYFDKNAQEPVFIEQLVGYEPNDFQIILESFEIQYKSIQS